MPDAWRQNARPLMDKRRITALGFSLLAGIAASGAFYGLRTDGSETPDSLWPIYSKELANAKYIDLTHAFAPGQPRGTALAEMTIADAVAADDIPGLIKRGEPLEYSRIGGAITAYHLASDQIGTQLDPPAHFNAMGATISDFPPTYALRPLIVINIMPQVKANSGYEATPADIAAWEQRHGRIPSGSVVMFRSDWSRLWTNPARFVSSPHPGVSLAALKLLHLERHILFHGHETADTDNTLDFKAESWLLKHNFAQAEAVTNLDQVPEYGALVVIGFAKPEGGTGGLARFVAIAPPGWPHGVSIADAPGAPLPVQSAPLSRSSNGVLRPSDTP